MADYKRLTFALSTEYEEDVEIIQYIEKQRNRTQIFREAMLQYMRNAQDVQIEVIPVIPVKKELKSQKTHEEPEPQVIPQIFTPIEKEEQKPQIVRPSLSTFS